MYIFISINFALRCKFTLEILGIIVPMTSCMNTPCNVITISIFPRTPADDPQWSSIHSPCREYDHTSWKRRVGAPQNFPVSRLQPLTSCSETFTHLSPGESRYESRIPIRGTRLRSSSGETVAQVELEAPAKF